MFCSVESSVAHSVSRLQGYGRVKLDNTLRMTGVADFDLYVLDQYSVTSEDTIELDLTITDTSKPIR
mgnify:CR=1 FL=1